VKTTVQNRSAEVEGKASRDGRKRKKSMFLTLEEPEAGQNHTLLCQKEGGGEAQGSKKQTEKKTDAH